MKEIPEIEKFRNLVYLIAESQLDRRLRGKIDADDLLQETMCLAYEKFGQLNTPDNESVVKRWLLTILGHVLIDQRRKFFAEKRDAAREQAVMHSIDASHAGLSGWVAASQTSPSMAAARNEEVSGLAEALRVLPADMREVVVRKHLNGESIKSIATGTDRTTASVAGLLRRGLARLRLQLATPDDSDLEVQN